MHHIFDPATNRVKISMTLYLMCIKVPRERIELYRKGKTVGSDDIALVKTSENIVFIPHKVVPVRATKYCLIAFKNIF